MRKGDKILCKDADDAIETMKALAIEGIDTEFDYSRKPKILLIVTKGDEI